MMNVFLGIAIAHPHVAPHGTTQSFMFAQGSLVYLSVTTSQSRQPQCTGFTARNNSSRAVRNVYVNYTYVDKTNGQSKPSRKFLASSLKPGTTVTFDLCERATYSESFRNVEAKQ